MKVARLAGATSPHELPLTALYRGDGLGGRVARLIERESAPVVRARSRRVAPSSIALAAVVLFLPAAAYLGVLHHVHQVIEAVVLSLG